MNIVIIEDELLTAQDLAATLQEVAPEVNIVQILHSKEAALKYFAQSSKIDLIFSDIELGDGNAFEIFEDLKINVPIIFCTAYNQFALQAFNTNGIHYILKPFHNEDVLQALEKYKLLKGTSSIDVQAILASITQLQSTPLRTHVLVHVRDKVHPIAVEDIALFYLQYKATYFKTFKGETHTINENLEQLEAELGKQFYRANRQVLIQKKAIKEAIYLSNRKYQIIPSQTIDEDILVSKEKMTSFLEWWQGA
jgi:two-component system, LytTR family, response regulator LytT